MFKLFPCSYNLFVYCLLACWVLFDGFLFDDYGCLLMEGFYFGTLPWCLALIDVYVYVYIVGVPMVALL